MGRIAFVGVLVAVVAAAIVGISPRHASTETTGCAAVPESLDKLTLADAPTPLPPLVFDTADGGERTLADVRGDAIVLNFWATWCAPCVREMPALDRLGAALAGDGVRVLAISEDRGGVKAAARFFDKNGIRHLPVLADRLGRALRSLKLPGLPTTLLIDAEGREIGRVVGPAEWDAPETIAYLRRCLGPAVRPPRGV